MGVRRTGDVPVLGGSVATEGTNPEAATPKAQPGRVASSEPPPLAPRTPTLAAPSSTGAALRSPGSSATSRLLSAVNSGDRVGAHNAIRQIVGAAPTERREAVSDALAG